MSEDKLSFWRLILRIQKYKQEFTNYGIFEVKQSNALEIVHLYYWTKEKKPIFALRNILIL